MCIVQDKVDVERERFEKLISKV